MQKMESEYGIFTFHMSLDPPASNTATLLFSSFDNLFESTQPADPAPIII